MDKAGGPALKQANHGDQAGARICTCRGRGDVESRLGKVSALAAAVVDRGGELVVKARMDGASALNARISDNKAETATKWGQNAQALKDRLFDMKRGGDRRDIAWFGNMRFTAVWGGIVLRSGDGTIVGALGESGGSPEQDEEIG
jgi:glc operon protein GlcG